MAQQGKATQAKAKYECTHDAQTYDESFAGKISYLFNEPGSYSRNKILFQTDRRHKAPLHNQYINKVVDQVYNIFERYYKNNAGLIIEYNPSVTHSIDNVKPINNVLQYILTTSTAHITCKNGYKAALNYTTPFEVRFNGIWGNASIATFYDDNKKDDIFYYENNQVYWRKPADTSYMGYEAWRTVGSKQLKANIESVLITPNNTPVFLPVPNKAHIAYKIRMLQKEIQERTNAIQKKPTQTWEQYQQENESRFKDRKRAYEKRNDLISYDKFVEDEKKYWQKQVDAIQHPEHDIYITKLKEYVANGEHMLQHEPDSFLKAPCFFGADGDDKYSAIKRSFYYTRETFPIGYNPAMEYVYYNPKLFNPKDPTEKLRFAYIYVRPNSNSTGIVGKTDILIEKLQQKLFTQEHVKKIAAILE